MFGIFKQEKDKKEYKLGDLYVGKIGSIFYEGKTFYCNSDNISNPFVIVIKKFEYEDLRDKAYGIQVTTGTRYDYFHSVGAYRLSEYVNEQMIGKSWPLASFFQELKGKESLSLEEIKKYEEGINNYFKHKDEKKDEPKEEPKDKVMVEINKLVDKAKEILNSEVKASILEEIKALATYYVESKITIQMESSGLNLDDPESKLISECLRKLCEIEEKIDKALKDNVLLKDMQILSRNIGSEE